MRKFGLLLAVATIAAFAAVSSQAALTSLYTFDTTLENAVAAAPDGTWGGSGSETYASGVIGNAVVYDKTQSQYVDPSTAMEPSAGDLWTGSVTFWLKTADIGQSLAIVHGRVLGSTTGISIGDSGTPGRLRIWIRSQEGKTFMYWMPAGGNALYDDQWHQLSYAWDITAGTAAIYVDGVAQTGSFYQKQIVEGTHTFNDYQQCSIGASNEINSELGVRTKFFTGSLDDVAAWGDELTAGEAAALFNMADGEGLNYGALDADVLFDVAETGAAQLTNDGLLWSQVTGLTGSAGSVTLSGTTWTVQLDNGIGVQAVIPEPGTLAMLVAGLMGLAAYAWRKRK